MADLPNANLSCFNQHEEILIEPEEMSFMQLFQDILNRIIEFKRVPEKSVEEAIIRAKESFKSFESPDLSKYDNLCAYLYRYASHGAGLTRRKVFDAVKNCDCLVSSLKKTRRLNVISLGGGPGNDAIGFCSALFDCGFKDALFDITVIDKYKSWSQCVTFAEEFIKKGNFGNVTKLFQQNAHMSFSKVDLFKSADDDYYKLLQNADIILIVKLISILRLDPAEMLIEDLHKNMKKEAVILYIDTPNGYLDAVWKNKFNVLYSSEDDIAYCSSARAPERFCSDDRVESGARIVVYRKM